MRLGIANGGRSGGGYLAGLKFSKGLFAGVNIPFTLKRAEASIGVLIRDGRANLIKFCNRLGVKLEAGGQKIIVELLHRARADN